MEAEKDKPLPETDSTKPENDEDDDHNKNVRSDEVHLEKPNQELPPQDSGEIAGELGIKDEDEPSKNADDPNQTIDEGKEPLTLVDGPEAINEEKGPAETSDAPHSDNEKEQGGEKADGDEPEIKEEEKPDDVNIEETPPSPLDLGKLSEEIDQYISSLSTPEDDESSPPNVPNFVGQFAGMVETKTADYDSGDTLVKWSQLSEEDSASFLESIARLFSLSKALSQFSLDKKYASRINLVEGVLQRAMSYVEEEFKTLLEDYKIQDSPDPSNANETKPMQSSSSTANQESEQTPLDESETVPEEENCFPGYSEEILSHLIRLTKAMMEVGHDVECYSAYFIARRNALEDSLVKLGVEKHSIDDVQKMPWESLEREIVVWTRAFKLCSTHFSSEHKLCTAIFPDHPSISQSIFCSLSQGVFIQLLNFSEAVALTKRSSEKLFKFLDTYEALRDTLPTIENLFPEEWMNEVRTEVSIIKARLGETIISIFSGLESSIKAESGKTPVPGGAVHPLTRYIVNYLKLAGEYKETLEQVYREHQKIERSDSATGSDFKYNSQATSVTNEVAKQSPFKAQMIKIMDMLDENIDGKSKLYKDHSLSTIFLMNNGRYILQKIRGSKEINNIMGDAWCRKKSTDLRQYHKVYQRETWGKLLGCLHTDGLITHGKVVKPAVKERFKSFNAMFDEIHRTQSTWVVCDEQLQSELRVSISNMVIPAYRSFLARYGQVFTPGRQTEKYVKYQGEDIENYIDELFDGKK